MGVGHLDTAGHYPGARTFLSAAMPDVQAAVPIIPSQEELARCCGQECPRAGPGIVPDAPNEFVDDSGLSVSVREIVE